MILTDEKREELVAELKEHEERAQDLRAYLYGARETWAAETHPSFEEWMAYVGDDPDQWASGQLMAWMNETGRRMG